MKHKISEMRRPETPKAEKMNNILFALREREIEDAPIEAEIKRIEDRHKEELAEAKALIARSKAECKVWKAKIEEIWQELEKRRSAAMLQGIETPPVKLPKWASFRQLAKIEIYDKEELPENYLEPDPKKIKADLLKGVTVPGAALDYKPSLSIRKPK